MASSNVKILSLVREKMMAHGVAALIVPSSDAHHSEYVAEKYQKRSFLTNFKGSAGTCLITQKNAFLWTDGRYWLEASKCLSSDWTLMKDGHTGVPSIEKYIQENINTDDNENSNKVGMDPYVCTVARWKELQCYMKLVPVPDFISEMMQRTISEEGKGKGKKNDIFLRPEKFCGQSCEEKLKAVQEEIKKNKCDLMVLSALDEIAWLTNLRGSDVEYNPVFYAYAVVSTNSNVIHLFVDQEKVTAEVRSQRSEKIMQFHPYEALESFLKDFCFSEKNKDLAASKNRISVLIDEYQTSEAIRALFESFSVKIRTVSCGPVQELKGKKNKIELEGFRACHVRDGIAVTRYLAWLTEEIKVKNNNTINEYEGALQLELFRKKDPLFIQNSFATISSSGSSGAIIHYSPTEKNNKLIEKNKIYLLDSGGQYWDGTTDVTRTVCFFDPTDEEKEAYTLVLKCNQHLSNLVFPKKISGHRLDAISRVFLWQKGLQYFHGTGHGVGSFLNVHEGPFGIGTLPSKTGAGLEEGQVISNEPGYYKEGAFGVRIENIEEIVAKETKYNKEDFLGFQTLTKVPLCRDLIEVDMLTEEEIEAVNRYQKSVLEALLPHLNEENDALTIAYLKYHTAPLKANKK